MEDVPGELVVSCRLFRESQSASANSQAGSATGKRKNEDDDAGPSKKRNRRSEPAKPTSKPKANGKGRKRKAGEEVLNHTSDEAMLPVYTSYCEKMQKQVKALEKDLGKTFIHVQDMTGLMQTSVWEAMQMVEKMKEARETLNDWKQACLSRR